MKIPKNKIAAITIAIFFILSMTASMTLIPNTNAHTPPWNIPTEAFCNASPNPCAVGQQITIGIWMNEPPPDASGQYGDRWAGLTVKVTLPDGTTTALGPFTTDDTGGTVAYYTPATVGNYTFQMSFPGQTLAGKNLAPGQTNPFIGDSYEASISNVATLTVGTTSASTLPFNPLPTSYWTRPINAENPNWSVIGGNYLGLGSLYTQTYNVSCNYNAWSAAPLTAHILWTKPDAFGGTVGGEFGSSETGNFYTNREYEDPFQPIIMNGILYYTMFPESTNVPAGWAAVNLQTGQTIWTKNTTQILRCGQLLDYVTPNQYGCTAYLWSMPQGNTLTGVTSGQVRTNPLADLEMWDAMTGTYICSITGFPVGSSSMYFTEDATGDLIVYWINSTGTYGTSHYAQDLVEWNSTLCINLNSPNPYGSIANGVLGPPVADDWDLRPLTGATLSYIKGVEYATPLPYNLSSGLIPSGWAIDGINSGVVIMIATNALNGEYQTGFEFETGYSQATGQQIWIANRTETPFTRLYGPTFFMDGDGVYTVFNFDTFAVVGYSDTTGAQLWNIVLPNPDAYDSLALYAMIVNSTLYMYGLGGDIYAINILTGAVLWHQTTTAVLGSSGYNTPYGVWTTYSQGLSTIIADGVIILGSGHEYSPPLFRGAQELALNTTNGQPIWNLLAFNPSTPSAISDGVLVFLNDYDNQLYALGQGTTKTTVTAPDVGVTTATPVTITGTVTDISAGSQQNAVAMNFPNGLPCVSDASMSQFMEAVYEQQPMPTNMTGVPVTISVTDSNGNHYNIGTAISSPTTGFYSLTWTPTIPGNFTVTATFAGTQAYYGSYAQAAFCASPPAPTAAPTATPVTGLASTGTVMLGVAAVIIVIIICVAVLAVLMLRKRP